MKSTRTYQDILLFFLLVASAVGYVVAVYAIR